MVSRYLSSSGLSHKETVGSPKACPAYAEGFPSYPREYMPWSQTPVVSCPLAISQTGLLPACHRLSFHVLYGSWLLAMAGKYFGAQYPAYIWRDWLSFSQVGLSRTRFRITHWVTITHFIPTYRDSQGLGFTLARAFALLGSYASCK